MIINWPVIIVLSGLSLPGISIALPRVISLLLPNNTDEFKKRMSRFAVVQSFIMVLVMSFAGTILSIRTGLNDKILDAMLQGRASFSSVFPIVLPTLLYAFFGLMIFCGLYYGVISRLIDEKSFQILRNIRTAIKIDGCVLYGGVVEEVIVRWGLMNLIAFFLIVLTHTSNALVFWISILSSGLIFGIGQMPAYIAAGCSSTRRFIYSILLLFLWQSVIFGFLFWTYGIISAILAHMLFHLGWALYDKT